VVSQACLSSGENNDKCVRTAMCFHVPLLIKTPIDERDDTKLGGAHKLGVNHDDSVLQSTCLPSQSLSVRAGSFILDWSSVTVACKWTTCSAIAERRHCRVR